MNETTTGPVVFDMASVSTTICSNSTFFVNDSTSSTSSTGLVFFNNRLCHEAKKDLIRKIVDNGQIELSSLTEEESIEIFEIDEMTHKAGNTRISCHKEIDLDYAGKILSKRRLLLETVSIPEKGNNQEPIDNGFFQTGTITWNNRQGYADFNYLLQDPIVYV